MMKKTLLALSLIGCLIFSATSCTVSDGEEGNSVASVEESGSGSSTPQGSAGEEDPQKPDGSGETETDDDGHFVKNGGANTEADWGALHPIG